MQDKFIYGKMLQLITKSAALLMIKNKKSDADTHHDGISTTQKIKLKIRDHGCKQENMTKYSML